MVIVTDANFEADVCRAALPVLLHVWASRCKASVHVRHELEKLAPSVAGKVRIAAANLADCRSLPKRLGILFLPTLILFVNGGEAARLSGVPTPDELADLVALIHDRTCPPQGEPS